MKMLLSCIFSTLILTFATTCIASENSIGIIKSVKGSAFIARQGKLEPARADSQLLQNDTLRTGPEGTIGLILKDDTVISMGPDTILVIDDFIFSPNEGQLSLITRMLKGTVVYISGIISKLRPESVVFTTPDTSLGIRGTKFLVEVRE